MDAIDRKAIEAILFLDKYCRSHVGDCEKCVACHCSGGACIDISLEQRAMLTNDLQHCGTCRLRLWNGYCDMVDKIVEDDEPVCGNYVEVRE